MAKSLEKRLVLKIFMPALVLVVISWVLYTVKDPLMKGAALVALIFFISFAVFILRKQWQEREDFTVPVWLFVVLIGILITFLTLVGLLPIVTMFTKPPSQYP
ncbi:MAG: hypothetical protein VST70_10210 [Nitrospirota bacterium]|nr:hypothetical protein [Nitrospirota bacterium]